MRDDRAPDRVVGSRQHARCDGSTVATRHAEPEGIYVTRRPPAPRESSRSRPQKWCHHWSQSRFVGEECVRVLSTAPTQFWLPGQRRSVHSSGPEDRVARWARLRWLWIRTQARRSAEVTSSQPVIEATDVRSYSHCSARAECVSSLFAARRPYMEGSGVTVPTAKESRITPIEL